MGNAITDMQKDIEDFINTIPTCQIIPFPRKGGVVINMPDDEEDSDNDNGQEY